jgi:uncharacterized protein (TIGR02231 family)
MTDERTNIELPIDEVTLLEDRAHVVRRGVVALPAGVARLRVPGVAPVAVDKTLAFAVVEGAARRVDARLRRRTVVRLKDEVDEELDTAAARLERELDGLDQRVGALRAEREASTHEAAALERVAAETLSDLADDASWGRAVSSEWGERLAENRGREWAALARVRELDHELVELGQLRQRLDARRTSLHTPAEDARADLELELIVDEAGPCTLRVEYLVPGACWRPWHRARLLLGDAPHVEVTTDACVWQNTGEDWQNAQLLLSTERASLGAEPPRLSNDTLYGQKKREAIVVEARDQHVETAGLGTGGATRAAAPELPGIDDGGRPVALRAPARASVPSDGRPWRIALSSFTSDAELAWLAFPEVTPCVLLRATLTNTGELPVLAGPVDLIRDSGLCGRTSTLFAAPGERFELGFGPDSELRVQRELDVSEEKSRTLSSWLTRRHLLEIRLSNLGNRPRRVEVKERVPVSEVEKVKVELDAERTSRGARPDGDGFVTWRVELAPRGHEKLVLAYALRRHESVQGL